MQKTCYQLVTCTYIIYIYIQYSQFCAIFNFMQHPDVIKMYEILYLILNLRKQ